MTRRHKILVFTLVITLGMATPCRGDDLRQRDMAQALESIEREADAAGGWQGWRDQLKPYHALWASHLESAPEAGKGLIAGADGFFFLRNWESYVLEADFISGGAADGESSALSTLIDLNRQLLERGIHFMVVPVPSRSEIYPENVLAPPPSTTSVAPQRKAFIAALLRNNVEAIDLLPPLVAAKAHGPVSLPNDTHWTSHGATVAAAAIAQRLERYDWATLYGRPPEAMKTATVDYNRSWSLVERMTPENQAVHPPGPVEVSQVRRSNDAPYTADPSAPLVIVGDSFLFFYGNIQADVAAHVGAKIGFPVATKPMGGGQSARVARTFARMTPAELDQYKVVVFIFLGPYLRYENWKTAPLPASAGGVTP